MKRLAAFLCVLWCSVAFAEKPVLTLTATEPKVAGDLLRIDATVKPVPAKSFQWQVWTDPKVSPPSQEQVDAIVKIAEGVGLKVSRSDSNEPEQPYMQFEGGATLMLPSWAGQSWNVACFVATAEGETDSRQIRRTIPGTPPGPTPVPIPVPVPIPPTPVPVPPAPVVDTLTTVMAVAVAQAVKPETWDEFDSIGKCYSGVASLIDKGYMTSSTAIENATSLLIKTRVSKAAEPWANIESLTLNPRLLMLKASGNLKSPEQYSGVWKEIAAGIKSGLGPQPPPVPPVPVPPVPPVPPQPDPIPVTGLHVLMVWDSENPGAIPESQLQVLTGATIRQWIRNQNGQFRVFDKDIDLSMTEKVWQDAMKIPRTSLPWCVISNGRTGFSGPLPKSIDEMTQLLEKYK